MATRARLRSLDGLRGLAAIVVLLHHIVLIDPWFYGALTSLSVEGGGIKRTIYFSPLHIFFAGTEAVMVFFVLSGFVLTRAISVPQSTQMSYILPRLMRLYIPIWGSVIISLFLTALRPSGKLIPGSEWHAAHIGSLNLESLPGRTSEFFGDLFVLSGTSWLNSSLWSMRVELMFSIFLVFVLILGRWGVVGFLSALVVAINAPNFANPGDVLKYLPYFVLGALLSKLDWRPSFRSSILLLVVGVTFFTLPWIARNWNMGQAGGFQAEIFYLVGASTIVLSALSDHGFGRLLGKGLFQYLGSRSYSLYLIHAPIVTLVGFWCMRVSGDVKYWPFWAPIALAASLALAELFYRAIERPSHRLANALKTRKRGGANSL